MMQIKTCNKISYFLWTKITELHANTCTFFFPWKDPLSTFIYEKVPNYCFHLSATNPYCVVNSLSNFLFHTPFDSWKVFLSNDMYGTPYPKYTRFVNKFSLDRLQNTSTSGCRFSGIEYLKKKKKNGDARNIISLDFLV